MQRVVQDPAGPTAFYEEHKRQDRDTEQQCEAQGFRLAPFILEAHSGAMGPEASKMVRELGSRIAARSGIDHGVAVSELAMRIQTTLQRETARATLRRLASSVDAPGPWQ